MSWVKKVRGAKKSEQGMTDFFKAVDPLLRRIAIGITSEAFRADVMQAGRVKIWKNFSKLDLTRPKTLKHIIIRIGVQGMRDEVRKQLIKSKIIIEPVDVFEIVDMFTKVGNTKHYYFKGLLKKYEDYIVKTGSFKHAHKTIAKQDGVTIPTARRRFHLAAKEFLKNTRLQEWA
ncbi:MAG: hypothetical protein KAS32_03270 [Candidatus Peribacteraceae bacterium]|nr:hypothetical protein [Candidatus Peribacteraceae bacterium]